MELEQWCPSSSQPIQLSLQRLHFLGLPLRVDVLRVSVLIIIYYLSKSVTDQTQDYLFCFSIYESKSVFSLALSFVLHTRNLSTLLSTAVSSEAEHLRNVLLYPLPATSISKFCDNCPLIHFTSLLYNSSYQHPSWALYFLISMTAMPS
jgi:hypothetical protein